ncbi:MAG: LysM peptidoglycan-binding domain-containing protein, partial [Acetatifactor sp.]
MAVDDETAWYSPLYLSAYYSTVSEPVLTAGADVYIVQRGDTLSRISRTNGMKLSELTAKNPQIKNPNKIVPGQVIYI